MNLTLVKYTFLNLLKLNRWISIGMAIAKRPYKKPGLTNSISQAMFMSGKNIDKC